MRLALLLFGGTVAALGALYVTQGYNAAYSTAYGAVVAIAFGISATFFWLWSARATPLALGMGISWAGCCGVMGWWWLFNLFGRPGLMEESPILFVFLAAYFVGGILHFQVILRSLGPKSALALLPAVLVVALSLLT